jgi:hypothetical protein
MADVPANELTADELAAINGAATPTALNPMATMADTVTGTELTALTGSLDWDVWVPTIAAIPAVDTSVARYTRIGNTIKGYLDYRGSDGDGWVPSTITDLPVAVKGVNARIPIQARQSVNGAAATDMIGYIDAETNLRIQFDNAAACVNAQAWQIYVWFEYEVAP